MRQELGLMSLLINALTVGGQDEFTLSELKDTALAYVKGEVPEVVTVLSKEDMEKFQKASAIEKVHETYLVICKHCKLYYYYMSTLSCGLN